MANVTLPTINAGEDDLKTLVKKLLNAYVMLTEELTYLLNNLDTRNINELNAELINAGTINANLVQIKSDLMAGGYIKIDGEGMKINDGTKDTFKADIEGKVTMTGAQVQSSEDSYPRVEMNPDENMFAAYAAADRLMKILALSGPTQSPQVTLSSSDAFFTFFINSGLVHLAATAADVTFSTNRNIRIKPGPNPYSVDVPFDQLRDEYSGMTLYQQLLGKASRSSSTGLSGGHNHGIPDGTQLRTADGGLVTFYAASQHSHAQQ